MMLIYKSPPNRLTDRPTVVCCVDAHRCQYVCTREFCSKLARMVLTRRERARAVDLVLKLYQTTLDKWEFERELAWLRFVWRVERELQDEFEREEQERWARQVAEIQREVWAEEAMAQAWADQFQ